ncbi:hypothetical protein SSX86_025196 [Deinandra increscens subsp. villosa]|uniref:Uncharacterized protein n=1 Tax=Deinandra increscens subsp. villosa TaxID=3103831 RepID=A0AAP0GMZ4_9ASTR
MVEQPTAAVAVKPSRSDEIVHPDQQLQISEQVRSHFDSLLPKRPPKPNRSDPDHVASELFFDESVTAPPEIVKLRSLISQSQVRFLATHLKISDRNVSIEEEFVETGYYRELVSIDKEHHTTGNGFIKVAREEDGLYDLRLQDGSYGGFGDRAFKSNPATNDWIPSSGDYYDQQDKYTSAKPNRSENW